MTGKCVSPTFPLVNQWVVFDYLEGLVSWSRVFMKARGAPCERRLGSLTGGRDWSAEKPRASMGLGLNLGGPP